MAAAREPGLGRDRVAAMAGIAADAGCADVVGPVAVDLARHLDHAARGLILILGLVGHVVEVMAVGTPLAFIRAGHAAWCNPACHGDHDPGELRLAEIAEHLDVLVDLAGARPGPITWRNNLGSLIGLGQLGEDLRALDLFEGNTPVSVLLGRFGWVLLAGCQQEAKTQTRGGNGTEPY